MKNNRKISVFYDHILQAAEQSGRTVKEILCMVRGAGIEAVEIRLEALLAGEEIPVLLKEADLQVSCIYEFYEMGLYDEQEKGRLHIDTAARFGAAKILVVPGFLSRLEAERMHAHAKSYDKMAAFMEKNKHVQKMAKSLSAMVIYGKEKGVTVTVEDFDGRTSPVSRMYGILWFMQKVPGLGYTLDTGNFAFSDEDVLAAWALLKDYVVHVHCKDRGEDASIKPKAVNRGLISVATGSGYLPIAELLAGLSAHGYEGYLAIEHFDAPNQVACIRQSAEFLLHAK